MMTKLLAVGLAAVLVVLGSCIFQNNPLEPNNPPTIQASNPQQTFFSMLAPDSCTFSISAVDPDGDDLAYAFIIGDSLLGRANAVTFYATAAGVYDIRGEARDGATKAVRSWQVTVLSKANEPPRITSSSPDQSTVACAVGDTLRFHFSAADDQPGSLQYRYLLDGVLLQSGSPDLSHRFMERGDYALEGVAWDGQFGDTVGWNVTVAGFPDTIPPGPINDLLGEPGPVDGSISLVWTAPGDDGSEGKAASYVVRTSTYPILTEADWTTAEGKPGEPVPSAAGTIEEMTIRNLISASSVYVCMRAVDDFFNLSPMGNSVKVAVRGIDLGGHTINGATGGPAQGIEVFTSLKGDTSDATGAYFIRDIPSYTTSARARDENSLSDCGSFYDVYTPINTESQLDKDFYMIPVFGLVSTVAPDQYQGRFIAFYKEITKTDGYIGRPTIYVGWNHWPLSVYNPPMISQGIDLQAACRDELAYWEQSTGCELFVEALSEEEADVVVVYDTLNDYRHHVETPERNPDGTPALKEIHIYTKNSELPLYRFAGMIFSHELGHVIGLDHSRNLGHLMIGLTTPRLSRPSTDEVRVVQTLYHMPNFFDYKYVLED